MAFEKVSAYSANHRYEPEEAAFELLERLKVEIENHGCDDWERIRDLGANLSDIAGVAIDPYFHGVEPLDDYR